ncbi:MAG: sugar ABC transporter ATP-binding protein [Paenibacillaceae bacterium ZCTH02-B3]|nr:MAG: sugar ABC transporter ATP-binding protein [Paenibacillaceae bacterium ZCTH02-B3]
MLSIKVVNLSKHFKNTVAIRQLNFEFAASRVTCLLGPSGCGKTTLLRIIAGLESPTSGDIYFGDERVNDLSTSRRNIGMVFQYPVVYRGISVYRNIELPLLREKIPASERKKRVTDVIDLLGLGEVADKDITQLDNASRQKVAMARAIARQPKIILFDEPITNVDTSSKLVLKRALKEVMQQLKQTIIYVTHDQTEAMTLADQIVLMKDGEIVQCDEPRKLYLQPESTFGGWFLGNPGMNFFEGECAQAEGKSMVKAPLFPAPLLLDEAYTGDRITIGIRPEHIKVAASPSAGSVRGKVVDNLITIGGQRLLTVEVNDQRIKAKVDHKLGSSLRDQVWLELPLDRIMLFDRDGSRIHRKFAGFRAG